MSNNKIEIDEEILIKLYKEAKTLIEIADFFKCSERTISRCITKLRLNGLLNSSDRFEFDKQNNQLISQNQKYKDLTRIGRRQLRTEIQLKNAIIEYNKKLIEILSKHKLPSFAIKKIKKINKGSTGIVHITDAHFNELVDLVHNKYDFPIASQRLRLLAMKTKEYFKPLGIKKILIAMTGDLMNSDRRLDELLSESTNRSKATFLAVNLLEHFILDLSQDFQITMANVVGNESRLSKDVGWTEMMASDNYDFTIYNILKVIFRNSNIQLLDGNLLEQIVEISGQNVLLIHGNQLKANSMEQSIQKIKGKYTSQKINIDFVLSGHLHSCRIGDIFARGSSLVGANAFSDSALQLESRASQNLHIFYQNGTRDSIKVDLQNTENIEGYDIVKELESYNAKSLSKAKKKKIVSNII